MKPQKVSIIGIFIVLICFLFPHYWTEGLHIPVKEYNWIFGLQLILLENTISLEWILDFHSPFLSYTNIRFLSSITASILIALFSIASLYSIIINKKESDNQHPVNPRYPIYIIIIEIIYLIVNNGILVWFGAMWTFIGAFILYLSSKNKKNSILVLIIATILNLQVLIPMLIML